MAELERLIARIFVRRRHASRPVEEQVRLPLLDHLSLAADIDTEEEAIRLANDTDYGLSGYVQSGDNNHAQAVAARLRTGNVHINGAGADFTAPFGGYKQSGNGREWGEYGFEEFLEVKAVMGCEG